MKRNDLSKKVEIGIVSTSFLVSQTQRTERTLHFSHKRGIGSVTVIIWQTQPGTA